MRATPLEFRYRLLLLTLVFLLGFWSPGFRTPSVWILAAAALAHHHMLDIRSASLVIGEFAALLAFFAAVLRTWAAAYLGSGVVYSGDFHSHAVVAAGPYRYLRNPLYLGSELNFIAMAIFMPLYGAIFALSVSTLLIIRFIAAEESRLAATPGYADYARRVPRILPSLSPRVPPSPAQPRWMQAFAGEIYCWGAAISMAAFVPQYYATRVAQGILVSLGLSFVLKGLWPSAKPQAALT